MSALIRIGIQGIRSFDSSRSHVLEFDPRLTLILGQNGAGKTSITESLRCACTGDFPPNSDKGKSFLHDPRMHGAVESKAMIVLEFRSRSGKSYQVRRSFSLSLRGEKSTIKTDQASIVLSDNNESHSRTCVNADKLTPELLGTTKALLDNVMICHQEDSTWPLDATSSVLKKKLDEIFASTRYSKAVQQITDVLKVKEHALSVANAELEGLRKDLDLKKVKLEESDNHVAEIRKVQDRMSILATEIASWKSRKEALRGFLEEWNTLSADEERLRSTAVGFEAITANSSQDSVANEAADAEMRDYISSFDERLREVMQEKQALESKVKQLSYAAKESESELRVVQEQYLRAETAKKISSEAHANLCDALGLSPASSTMPIVTEAMNRFEASASALETEIAAIATRHRSVRAQLMRRSDTARSSLRDLNRERDSLLKKQNLLTSKLRELKSMAVDVDEEKARHRNLTERLARSQTELSALRGVREEQSHMLDFAIVHTERLRLRKKIDDEISAADAELQIVYGKMLECVLASDVRDGLRVTLDQQLASAEGQEREQLYQAEFALRSHLSHVDASSDGMMHRAAKDLSSDELEASIVEEEEKLDKLEADQSLFESMQKVYQSFATVVRDRCACPVCERGFPNREGASETVASIERKLQNLPQLFALKQADILRTKQNIVALRSTLALCKIGEARSKVEFLKRRLHSRSTLLALFKELDSKPISGVRSYDGTMTVDDLRQKMRETDAALRQLGDDVEALKEAQRVATNVIDKAERHTQDVAVVEGELDSIVPRLTLLTERSIPEAVKEDEEASAQLLKLDEDHASAMSSLESQSRISRSKVLSLKPLWDAAKPAMDGSAESSVVRCHESCALSKSRLETLVSEKCIAVDRLSELQNEVSLLANRRSVFADVLAYRQTRRRIQSLQSEILTFVGSFGASLASDVAGSLVSFLSAAEDKCTTLAGEHDYLRGRRVVLEEHLSKIRSQLESTDALRDVEKLYSEKAVECKVLQLARNDLATYRSALEAALVAFHDAKMAEVNAYIRDIWHQTYTGHDIDDIEITSTVEEGVTTSSRRASSYHYAVRMRRHGATCEMRGRCSAGQKVLASIVIRLALARAFSMQCGILVLDEPTVNLDVHNTASLADGLAALLRASSASGSMQLVVITHDSHFCDMLGRNEFVDSNHFYRVEKDAATETSQIIQHSFGASRNA